MFHEVSVIFFFLICWVAIGFFHEIPMNLPHELPKTVSTILHRVFHEVSMVVVFFDLLGCCWLFPIKFL